MYLKTCGPSLIVEFSLEPGVCKVKETVKYATLKIPKNSKSL